MSTLVGSAAAKLASLVVVVTCVTCAVVACVGDGPAVVSGPPTDGQDAGPVDDAAVDEKPSDGEAAPQDVREAGGCRLNDPFREPQPLSINDPSASTAFPRPTAAGLYFTSNRMPRDAGSGSDLWFARRDGVGFATPQRLLASTLESDAAPTETMNGLTLYFDAQTANGRLLHRATRNTLLDEFATSVPMSSLLGGFEERTPYVVGDALYFAAKASAVSLGKLYRVPLVNGEPMGTPIDVQGIDPTWDVAFPVVTKDETTIYFARIISEAKIYVATRKTAAAPFDPAQPLNSVNIGVSAVPTSISTDGCELHLHVVNEAQKFDAYVARKPE